MKQLSKMNVSDLVAIDVHTHAEISKDGHASLPDELNAASVAYFKVRGSRQPSVDEIAAYYRERKIAAVVFTVNAETATGHPPVPNEEVAERCAANSDVLIPFASVDPWQGKAAAREARRMVKDYGVRGFKFHPNIQAFFPNDHAVYPIYEAIQELQVPALFHTGHSGIGSGVRGGGGIRLKYSNPMCVDDVACDFPDMPIILAHPSFPWQDEALSVAMHKQQVYIDLSGWSPRLFPPQLIRYANGQLKHKMLFGSDYPLITPERWIADFEQLDIKPEVRPLILRENAIKLLGLDKL